jgi:hypothetical protein
MTLNASTLPDQPRGYYCNKDTAVPTTKAGVYEFISWQHGDKKYPALHINESVPVVRFKYQKGDTKQNTGDLYDNFSTGINIHKGGASTDSIYYSNTWANSAGCLTIHPEDYNSFAKIVGFDKDGDVKYYEKADYVSGTVVINRDFMNTDRKDLQSLYGENGLKKIR